MKAGWKIQPLSKVAQLINGRAYKKPELLEEGKYPVVRVGNFFTNNKWYYSNLELPDKNYCHNGDLLYAWSASFGPRIWEGETAIFHYHIWKLTFDPETIDKKFLFYLLDWDKERIKAAQGTGTTMIHVSKGSMEARELPIPPLEEQQAIVDKLDRAFAGLETARANAEANLENAKELFQSILDSKLFPDGAVSYLGDAVDIQTGYAFSSKGYSDSETDTNLIRGDNVDCGELNLTTVKRWPQADLEGLERYALEANDLLVAMDRTWISRGIKRALVAATHLPAYLVQRVARLRAYESASARYIYFVLSSTVFERYVLSIQTGSGVPHVSAKQLSEFCFPLPSVDTQRAILENLNMLQAETDRLQEEYNRQLEDLDELKQSLLQKAFAGELT